MTALRGRFAEWFILVLLVTGMASASAKKREINANVNGKLQDVIGGFDKFDWNLMQSVAASSRGNSLISPVSLKLALVLLYEGAVSETAKELAAALDLPDNKQLAREKYINILKSLQEKKPEYSLNFGSRIYVDKSVLPRQQYSAIATTFYDTDVLNANFSDTHPTAKAINDFVSNVTEGHIPKLITNEESLKDNLMMIVNSLYFKGIWEKQPFPLADTTINQFFTAGNNVQVPYMRANGKFDFIYSRDLDAKILRLPYAGQKYAMYFVLPEQRGDLDSLVKKITPNIINQRERQMNEMTVDIMIPKFKFDFTSHLENTLRALGIRDIFEEAAMLTGILRSKSTSRRLVVSDIVQKAGIEVNEQGTVAYVATEVEIGNKMSDETFHASHPFLFYIKDETGGSILYMGIVNNPLEETGTLKGPQPQQQPQKQPLDNEVGFQKPITTAETRPEIVFDDRQNYFNIELLQQLNEAQPGNVIVGTESIRAALLILAEAAVGKTQEQILSSLRIPPQLSELRKAASSSLTEYKDLSGITELQAAVKIWLGKHVSLSKNYSEALRTYYNADCEVVDFANYFSTASSINDWIRKFSRGRINTLAEPGALTGLTKLLLTTAMYFKGTWLKAFDVTATRSRCFDVPGVGCRQMPMMENLATYKYAYVPSLDADVVQIPYTGKRLAMLVMLPKMSGAQALSVLSRDVAFTPMSMILSALQETELLLQLPRFSINNKINVNNALAKLKIRDLFSRNANLSAGFPTGDVRLGAIVHNAQIEVTEEGTEAIAVSEAHVIPLIGTTTTTFRADRPFLFFLLDLQTNSILFAGRYFQPDTSAPHNAIKRN